LNQYRFIDISEIVTEKMNENPPDHPEPTFDSVVIGTHENSIFDSGVLSLSSPPLLSHPYYVEGY
jgi:hypothetical protein